MKVVEEDEALLVQQVKSIPGPLVVVGAGGFVGAHLFSAIAKVRQDISGTVRPSTDLWRLEALGTSRAVACETTEDLLRHLDSVNARTVFNLAAHGAYASQVDENTILQSNLGTVLTLADWSAANGARLIQAGSSSEYGINSRAPSEENARPRPNSFYAVTKLSASLWLEHLARNSDLACVSLRLYSVYGPLEEPSRLIPTLIRDGLAGRLPPFAQSSVSRDFVFIDDVVKAFLLAANQAATGARGLTLNIGTGSETTMRQAAAIANAEFGLDVEPQFGQFSRHWDLESWFADPSLANRVLGWTPQVEFAEGFHRTRLFYSGKNLRYLEDQHAKKEHATSSAPRKRVSVVVACYRDAQAIPYMYERVKSALENAELDFELILVNDSSPDNTLEVIEELSSQDDRVTGITHSRNFGSQSAFLSGMRMASGHYVALLDGDLQDPPEMLPDMIELINSGFDVAYGRRVGRDAPRLMRFAYKAFYRLFSRLSPFEVPRDAGDFSVMTPQVARSIASMPERDLFLRAQRAYVGFRQVGVDYIRPERMFGRSTNNVRKNMGWAMRGLLSVSRAPLTALSLVGASMFVLALFLIAVQIILKIFLPDVAPEGLATVSILILGMGAVNILGISIVGEYVGRILEESKRRPRYIQTRITRAGQTRMTEERDK